MGTLMKTALGPRYHRSYPPSIVVFDPEAVFLRLKPVALGRPRLESNGRHTAGQATLRQYAANHPHALMSAYAHPPSPATTPPRC
jgi:hypothetical protein